MAQPNHVPSVYNSVVNDVINNVREAFLDESVDEQVLQELKQLWESKLRQSKAVEGLQPEQDHMVSMYAQQHQGHIQQQQQQQQQAQAQAQAQQVQQQQLSQAQASQAAVQLPLYNPATGTIDLSGAAQAATIALPAGLYQQQLAALGGGTIIQGQGGTQYIIQTAPGQVLQAQQAAPTTQVTTAPQQPQTSQGQAGVIQLDGAHDSSSEEEEEPPEEEEEEENEEEENAEGEDDGGEEEEPLCSDDDVSEDDPTEVFDTENVIVCQFDKINRSKNRWKFHLKDGIMNLNGRDYVFQKALGDAEW